MRTINFLLFAFIYIALVSCNDVNETSVPDYSVLGVSSITVNNTKYNVNDSLYLDVNSPYIFITGTQMTVTTRHCTITYTVGTSDTLKSVSAESIYSNVSIIENSDTTASGFVFKTIDITRPNYDEHLTYQFYFADIDD